MSQGTKITTANAAIIKIGIKGIASTDNDMYEAANFLNGEFKDEPTVQDVKAKNTTSGIGITTYHTYTGSGTWQRTEDDPVQLYIIKLSEGKIGTDCQTRVDFIGSDGITRSGIFNVSATELGFSGEADALCSLEVDFTKAQGEITVTYPSNVEAALAQLQGN